MKKLLCLLSMLILVSQFVIAQIAEGIYKTRYVDFYEWSYILDKYESDGGDWMECVFEAKEDYYTIDIPYYEPKTIYWKHTERRESGDDIYETEDGRKMVFSYSKQCIVFFSELNTENGRYEKCMILSKISKE